VRHLPQDAALRKQIPLHSGLVKYFPDALVAIAKLSFDGNDQHNPGTPLHWDRSKSTDHRDALMRHILDEDWNATAWRALAILQLACEKSKEKVDEIDYSSLKEAVKELSTSDYGPLDNYIQDEDGNRTYLYANSYIKVYR